MLQAAKFYYIENGSPHVVPSKIGLKSIGLSMLKKIKWWERERKKW